MSNTTPGAVRAILPDLLYAEEDLGQLDSGTNLVLINSAFEVPTILRDTDTLVVDTDYTFIRPRTITLGTAATGENYTAFTQIIFSDSQITTFIDESDRIISNQFVNRDTPADEYLGDWSKYLTVHKILLMTAHGDLERITWARSFRAMAFDGIKAYKEFTASGTFEDSQIDRCDATSVNAFMLDQEAVNGYEDGSCTD